MIASLYWTIMLSEDFYLIKGLIGFKGMIVGLFRSWGLFVKDSCLLNT